MPNFVSIDREIHSPTEDLFDWKEQAETLALLLALPGRPTPLTIGIQGDWGSGKTSFINLVLSYLGERTQKTAGKDAPLADRAAKHTYSLAQTDQFKKWPDVSVFVIKFDSWVFTQSEWSADYLFPIYIVQVLVDYLIADNKYKIDGDEARWLNQIVKLLPKFGSGVAAAGGAMAGGLGIGVGALLALTSQMAGDSLSEWLKNQTPTEPQRLNTELVSFKHHFQNLVDELLAPNDQQAESLEKKFAGSQRHYNRLIVLVDDLDRVQPLTAVNITEKIKLFMDVPGCIFILASDLKIIRAGLREKLGREVGDDEGKNYLDKIVKIQYQVPQISKSSTTAVAQNYYRFCDTFEDAGSETIAIALLNVFPTIAANPRNLKRVLNNFQFTLDLHCKPGKYELANDSYIDFAFRILAVTVLQQHDPKIARNFYNWLAKEDGEQVVADVDALSKSLPPNGEPNRDIVDFTELIIKLGFTVKEWRSAFTYSTLTPINE